MAALMTPLLLLALLFGPYLAARLLAAMRGRKFEGRDAGAFGAALLFLFASIGHFVQTEAMTGMLPGWVPMRTLIIYATGVFEIALTAGILVRSTRHLAGRAAIVMLIAFLPANIHAALNGSPTGGGSMGPLYLLIRVPLQLIFISWIHGFCVAPARRTSPALA